MAKNESTNQNHEVDALKAQIAELTAKLAAKPVVVAAGRSVDTYTLTVDGVVVLTGPWDGEKGVERAAQAVYVARGESRVGIVITGAYTGKSNAGVPDGYVRGTTANWRFGEPRPTKHAALLPAGVAIVAKVEAAKAASKPPAAQ